MLMQTVFRVPRMSSQLRLGMIAYGALLLFWMGLEDNTTLPVAVLGSGLAFLIVAGVMVSRLGGVRLRYRLWLLLMLCTGLLTGALAVIMTVLLMFFKTAWHAHPFPDYPPQMMLDMLHRLPVWSMVGLCVSLAVVLMHMAVHNTSSQTRS